MSLSCILIETSERFILADSAAREVNQAHEGSEVGDRSDDPAMIFYAEYELRAFGCLSECLYPASIARIRCEYQKCFTSAYPIHVMAEP